MFSSNTNSEKYSRASYLHFASDQLIESWCQLILRIFWSYFFTLKNKAFRNQRIHASSILSIAWVNLSVDSDYWKIMFSSDRFILFRVVQWFLVVVSSRNQRFLWFSYCSCQRKLNMIQHNIFRDTEKYFDTRIINCSEFLKKLK